MFTLLTSMKNEGIFIVEWVAFHRALGFEMFVVFTNDCDDATVPLLKAIQRDGGLIHVHNKLTSEETPQASALRQGFAMDVVQASEWVLVSDVDEFLVIDLPDHSILGLADLASDSDAVAILWKSFGSQGYLKDNGSLIHERYLMCQKRIRSRHAFHKTFFRPRSFGSISPHMPKLPVRGRQVKAINTAGKALAPRSMFHQHRDRWIANRSLLTWENAAIHHYAVKSRDVLQLKRQRGRANGTDAEKYDAGAEYDIAHDTNDVLCLDALKYSEAFHREYEKLLAVPGVETAMRDSRAWFAANRSKYA